MLNGRDLRQLPLIERKGRLKAIMPSVQSRVRYVDHVVRPGSDFYQLVCDHDLEGVVAKWNRGTYQTALPAIARKLSLARTPSRHRRGI